MDFDLTEEQRLLKESVERLLADRYAFEQRQAYGKSADGWSRELWRAYAEMGLLGLPFAEAEGGFGGGPVETMIVMEALGRVLALEPFLSTVVLCGGLLRRAGHTALLPRVADGSLLLAFAHGEPRSRWRLDHVETAVKDGRLTGEKAVVLHGDSADKLIVSARDGRGRIGLYLVDATEVTRRGYPTQDGQRAAEIRLAGAPAETVLAEDGMALIEHVVDEALAALAAEAVGAMAALHELTVEYLKTRRQFGMPIGAFQALQHRAVEMLVALEQARSMAMFATMMAGEADPAERRKALAAAKVQVGRSARFVGQQAIQLHGGIGMTDEYKAGHYFKRLTMIDRMFGPADHHLERLAEAGGLFEAG
jgi:pimeloyl-CoA dehydrogenase small subunit